MQKKSNYIKNGLIVGALSLPLLFGGCYKEGQRSTVDGLQSTVNSEQSTVYSQQTPADKKIPKSLESIVGSKKFHENLSNKESKSLDEKYGDDVDSIHRKLFDEDIALYGKSSTGLDIYTDIEENENKGFYNVVWYSVFNKKLVRLARKTIRETQPHTTETFLDMFKKQYGYFTYFYGLGRSTISIYKNIESDDYDQRFPALLFSIPNSSFVKFKRDDDFGVLKRDGSIVNEYGIIDNISKEDLGKVEKLWEATAFWD
ncbi:MAG: hypothetical protein WC260_02075 [Candidatus Pacearchaeota archaeon]